MLRRRGRTKVRPYNFPGIMRMVAEEWFGDPGLIRAIRGKVRLEKATKSGWTLIGAGAFFAVSVARVAELADAVDSKSTDL